MATEAPWSARETHYFLKGVDLVVPAETSFKAGFNGKDLHDATKEVLMSDLRLSPFAACKIVLARDAYLKPGQ